MSYDELVLREQREEIFNSILFEANSNCPISEVEVVGFKQPVFDITVESTFDPTAVMMI